jgi:GntR family transcriptional regulator
MSRFTGRIDIVPPHPQVYLDRARRQLYPLAGTVETVLLRLNPAAGQPLYLQLIDQIRHAAETGLLKDGDQLPGIRTLAEELVVSPNTVVKAYAELENEGLLEMRQGSGAYVTLDRRARRRADRVQIARRRISELIERLRDEGLADEEIRRAFEAELLYPAETARHS